MSDLIKREDAIETIHNYWKKRLDTLPTTDIQQMDKILEHNKALCNFIEAIPSADRPQEWIPCSERLPRPYTEVLVCDECGWVSLGSYRPCDVTEKDSGWSTLTSIKLPTDEVLAWMPLPKPWKGADDE